jgi:hypothetical protein
MFNFSIPNLWRWKKNNVTLTGVKNIRKGKNQGYHHSMWVKKTSTFTTSYPKNDTKHLSLDHNPEPTSHLRFWKIYFACYLSQTLLQTITTHTFVWNFQICYSFVNWTKIDRVISFQSRGFKNNSQQITSPYQKNLCTCCDKYKMLQYHNFLVLEWQNEQAIMLFSLSFCSFFEITVYDMTLIKSYLVEILSNLRIKSRNWIYRQMCFERLFLILLPK